MLKMGGLPLSEASDWLVGLLEDVGEMDKREILTLANKNKLAERTVHRARIKAGIQARTIGFGKEKRSLWRMPENPIHAKNPHSCQEIETQKLGTNGELGTIEGSKPAFVDI